MKGICSVTLKIIQWKMGNVKTQQASTVCCSGISNSQRRHYSEFPSSQDLSPALH